MSVPRPARGSCTRVRLGASELILEAVRGGHSLLWTNGRQARRYAVGLEPGGHLTLQLRAPKLPLQVAPREVVTLVPGGRLAGYLQVSLVPTLTWHAPGQPAHTLLELLPEDFAAEWEEATGHVFCTQSPWLVRFPMRSDEPRVVVPVRLCNASAEVASPAVLPLTLRDRDLTMLRGSIVVRPRRLRWNGVDFTAAAGDAAALGAAS